MLEESDQAPGVASFAAGMLLKGRYRLERVLGRGGMASVWRADDTVLDRTVAVKVLADTLASDPEFQTRFRREARVVAGLRHPNLFSVYDYAGGDERPYLVMEYVSGGSLAERMRQGAKIDTRRLADELLGAVDHIHRAGIVHRDIKPQNILLAPDGSAKLIDFGIALPFDATALTRTGHLLGTARYLAPELLDGGVATARSDLYSCGIVLRQCLGDCPADDGLRAAVEWMCADDPRARPPSAKAALTRIDRCVAVPEQPTQRFAPRRRGRRSEPWTPPRRAPALEQRTRRPAWPRAAAAVALLTAVALAILLAVGGSQDQGGEEAVPALAQGAKKHHQAAGDGKAQAAGGEGRQSAPLQSERPQESEPTSSPVPAAAGSDAALGAGLNAEGYELIQAGEYEQAVPLLEEAVRAFPPGTEELDYAYALFNLGNALRLSGHPEDAIPILERRLQIPNQTGTVSEELDAARSEVGQ
jgi:serine/threonine-protein kinase